MVQVVDCNNKRYTIDEVLAEVGSEVETQNSFTRGKDSIRVSTSYTSTSYSIYTHIYLYPSGKINKYKSDRRQSK